MWGSIVLFNGGHNGRVVGMRVREDRLHKFMKCRMSVGVVQTLKEMRVVFVLGSAAWAFPEKGVVGRAQFCLLQSNWKSITINELEVSWLVDALVGGAGDDGQRTRSRSCFKLCQTSRFSME